MDLKREIRELEQKGVFIHLGYDHYTTGTNCIWSIEFQKTNNQTGWYGDNNEFGDTVDCLIIAVKFANWFLERDNLKWFFYNPTETVTEEGRANYRKYSDVREKSDKMLYEKFIKEKDN